MDDEPMMLSTWPYSVDANVAVSSGVDSLNVYSTSKLGEPMVPLTLQNCVQQELAPSFWTGSAGKPLRHASGCLC